MNHQKVTTQLKNQYPDKKIIKLPEDNPTEILCEIEPTKDHPEYSVAISVIDRSVPHHHEEMSEIYEVIKGDLSVFVDGVEHKLKEGETFHIKPGHTHYAVGEEAWIKCTARPGWSVSDHIMEETQESRGK